MDRKELEQIKALVGRNAINADQALEHVYERLAAQADGRKGPPSYFGDVVPAVAEPAAPAAQDAEGDQGRLGHSNSDGDGEPVAAPPVAAKKAAGKTAVRARK